MKRLILGALFCVWCFGSDGSVPGEGEQQIMYLSDNLHIACDPYEISLTEIDVRFDREEPTGVWTIVTSASWTETTTYQPGAVPRIPLYGKVKDLPDGNYRFRIRVRNKAGVHSAWSDWVYTVKDWTPPPQPSGCVLLR